MIEWLILTYTMLGIMLVTADARGIVNGSFLEVLFLWWLVSLIMLSIDKIIRLLKKRKNEKSKKLK